MKGCVLAEWGRTHTQLLLQLHQRLFSHPYPHHYDALSKRGKGTASFEDRVEWRRTKRSDTRLTRGVLTRSYLPRRRALASFLTSMLLVQLAVPLARHGRNFDAVSIKRVGLRALSDR